VTINTRGLLLQATRSTSLFVGYKAGYIEGKIRRAYAPSNNENSTWCGRKLMRLIFF